MKQLLLLRHAKAVPAETAANDAARQLAPRGERDARIIAERLRDRGVRLELMLTSPAARTLRTAEIVAEVLGYRRDAIVVDERLYLASPREILAVIATTRATIGNLLVVGHNPGLSEVAAELLPELATDDLPTAGIAALEVQSDDWASVGAAPRRLTYYDFPKNPAPTTR